MRRCILSTEVLCKGDVPVAVFNLEWHRDSFGLYAIVSSGAEGMLLTKVATKRKPAQASVATATTNIDNKKQRTHQGGAVGSSGAHRDDADDEEMCDNGDDGADDASMVDALDTAMQEGLDEATIVMPSVSSQQPNQVTTTSHCSCSLPLSSLGCYFDVCQLCDQLKYLHRAGGAG
jgi:hypothetical protein